MAATRTGAARVPGRYCDEMPAFPRQLVVQLAAELEPALIEDGLVQAGLGLNLLPRLFGVACRRLGQVPYLQVIVTFLRVVLADRGRGLVQVVAAGITDAGMHALDFGLGLLPVVAEFGLTAHRLLSLAQGGFVPFETVELGVFFFFL